MHNVAQLTQNLELSGKGSSIQQEGPIYMSLRMPHCQRFFEFHNTDE